MKAPTEVFTLLTYGGGIAGAIPPLFLHQERKEDASLEKTVLLALTLLLCMCACAKPQDQEPEFVLTYAENHIQNYPTALGGERFAQLVKERTDGKVLIQVKYAGEYGTDEEVVAQMRFGDIDFARISLAVIADEIPVLNALQMPFLYRDATHMWRILDGEIGTDLLDRFQETELVGLSWYDSGARSFYATKPIRSIEDLKGMTIRVQNSQLAMEPLYEQYCGEHLDLMEKIRNG